MAVLADVVSHALPWAIDVWHDAARNTVTDYLGRVNFDAYAHRGAALVNSRLATVDDLRDIHALAGWESAEPKERDLIAYRRVQSRLREIFDMGAAHRDTEAVAAINTLLEAYPVQPRISGHDASDWHMHVTGRGATASAEFLAGAIWGLAVWLCEYGSERFGVCADDRCRNVYLDTSSNCCRRFCSERCATRSHVAAHRARKRAAGDEVPVLAEELASAGVEMAALAP